MHSSVLLAFILSLASVMAIDFESQALKNYHACGEMSKQTCLTWHEAQDKCGGESCSQAGNGGTPAPGGTTPAPGGTTAPPDDNDKGAKKGKGKGKGGGGGKCFHGDDVVVTNHGAMPLKDIVGKQDMQILSRTAEGGLELSPVMSWLHADAEKSTEFLEVTSESGHQLHLTPKHLIYQTDCHGQQQTMFAAKLTLGQCLLINDDNGRLVESKIVGKVSRQMKGIFAPVTVNGNVVVNGVLASCYVDFEDEALQVVIFKSLNALRNALSHVTPQVVVDTFMNSPFNNDVSVPQLFLSFLDLVSTFVK